MPELPEVETVVRSLVPRVVGATIEKIRVARPDYVSPAGVPLSRYLVHHVITDISRRGKRILFTLDDSNRFLIHLGMTGRVSIEPPTAPRVPHTHVTLTLSNSRVSDELFQLRLVDPRRFGQFVWLGQVAGDEGLGPEPLLMRPAGLCAILSASRRPIKSLLLDQSRIAGIGNIYADESLFVAGIHPLTPADRITGTAGRRLCRAIKQILTLAIEHRGSTVRDYRDAAGGRGNFQSLHNVYDQAGQPCRKCGSSIVRITVAGRSSCFCPKCQPTV